MVEKMGHKKRMKIMRMEWINQGKPHNVHEDSIFDDPSIPPRANAEQEKTTPRIAPIFETIAGDKLKTPVADVEVGHEDLYDATPKSSRTKTAEAPISQPDSIFGSNGASLFGPKPSVVDGPPDDELDALLAEEDLLQSINNGAQFKPAVDQSQANNDNFEDEMEIMAEMDMDDMM
jgi:replication fork protection complex subunit Csm3/Swi3